MKPGYIIDDHIIENLISNEGACGDVYMARHQTSNDSVALKMTKNIEDQTDLDRFNTENKIMHALSPHINILAPKSFVLQHSSNHYYTMELADLDLDSHLISNPNLSFTEKFNIFKDICAGLKHAHISDFAHRDLHWKNILVKLEDSAVIKVSDFGKAKDFSTSAISLTSKKPCWGYFVMPPEIEFRDKDDLSMPDYIVGDMYALGILLFSIFFNIPEIETYSMKVEIRNFLKMKSSIDTLSRTQRNRLYLDWIESSSYSNQHLKGSLNDLDETNTVNSLLKKLTNIDSSKRFQSIVYIKKL